MKSPGFFVWSSISLCYFPFVWRYYGLSLSLNFSRSRRLWCLLKGSETACLLVYLLCCSLLPLIFSPQFSVKGTNVFIWLFACLFVCPWLDLVTKTPCFLGVESPFLLSFCLLLWSCSVKFFVFFLQNGNFCKIDFL